MAEESEIVKMFHGIKADMWKHNKEMKKCDIKLMKQQAEIKADAQNYFFLTSMWCENCLNHLGIVFDSPQKANLLFKKIKVWICCLKLNSLAISLIPTE